MLSLSRAQLILDVIYKYQHDESKKKKRITLTHRIYILMLKNKLVFALW